MSRRRGKNSPSRRAFPRTSETLRKLRTAEDGTPLEQCERCKHFIHPREIGHQHDLPDGGKCKPRRRK